MPLLSLLNCLPFTLSISLRIAEISVEQFQLVVIRICNWPEFTSEFLSPQVSVTLYSCAAKKLLVQSLHEGKTRKT